MYNRTIQPPRHIPRSEEHIDISGHLKVPHATSIEPTKKREGWVPFWVNINLKDDTQKVVSYKRKEA